MNDKKWFILSVIALLLAIIFDFNIKIDRLKLTNQRLIDEFNELTRDYNKLNEDFCLIDNFIWQRDKFMGSLDYDFSKYLDKYDMDENIRKCRRSRGDV